MNWMIKNYFKLTFMALALGISACSSGGDNAPEAPPEVSAEIKNVDIVYRNYLITTPGQYTVETVTLPLEMEDGSVVPEGIEVVVSDTLGRIRRIGDIDFVSEITVAASQGEIIFETNFFNKPEGSLDQNLFNLDLKQNNKNKGRIVIVGVETPPEYEGPFSMANLTANTFLDLNNNLVKDPLENWSLLNDGAAEIIVNIGPIRKQNNDLVESGTLRISRIKQGVPTLVQNITFIEGFTTAAVRFQNRPDLPESDLATIRVEVLGLDNNPLSNLTRELQVQLVSPVLQITGNADFGTLVFPNTQQRVLTVRNNGTARATNLSFDLPSPFSILATPGGCTLGQNLNINQECNILVEFQPTSGGTLSTPFQVSSSPQIIPTAAASITLTAQAISAPVLSLDSESITIPLQPCGAPVTVETFIINTGDLPGTNLTISTPTPIDGSPNRPITITSPPMDNPMSPNLDAVVNCGDVLLPGRKCRIRITYSPNDWQQPVQSSAVLSIAELSQKEIRITTSSGQGAISNAFTIIGRNNAGEEVDEVLLGSNNFLRISVGPATDVCNRPFAGATVFASVQRGSLSSTSSNQLSAQVVNSQSGTEIFNWYAVNNPDNIGENNFVGRVQSSSIELFSAGKFFIFKGIYLKANNPDRPQLANNVIWDKNLYPYNLGSIKVAEGIKTFPIRIKNDAVYQRIPSPAIRSNPGIIPATGVSYNIFGPSGETITYLRVSPTSTCGSTIQRSDLTNNNICNVVVIADPQFEGTFSGTLRITANEVGRNLLEIPISFSAVAPPVINFLNAPIQQLGSFKAGASKTATLTLQNNSTLAVLNNPAFTVTGDYSVISNNCNNIPAGSSCSVNISLNTDTLGNHSGTVTATAEGNTATITLNASVIPGDAFGTIPVVINKPTVPALPSSSNSVVTITAGPVRDVIGNIVAPGTTVRLSATNSKMVQDFLNLGYFEAQTNAQGMVSTTYRPLTVSSIGDYVAEAGVYAGPALLAGGLADGEYTGAILSLEVVSYDFGILDGINPSVVQVLMTNLGNADIDNGITYNFLNNNEGIFSLGANTTCANSLAADASCILEIQVNEVSAGIFLSTLNIQGSLLTTQTTSASLALRVEILSTAWREFAEIDGFIIDGISKTIGNNLYFVVGKDYSYNNEDVYGPGNPGITNFYMHTVWKTDGTVGGTIEVIGPDSHDIVNRQLSGKRTNNVLIHSLESIGDSLFVVYDEEYRLGVDPTLLYDSIIISYDTDRSELTSPTSEELCGSNTRPVCLVQKRSDHGNQAAYRTVGVSENKLVFQYGTRIFSNPNIWQIYYVEENSLPVEIHNVSKSEGPSLMFGFDDQRIFLNGNIVSFLYRDEQTPIQNSMNKLLSYSMDTSDNSIDSCNTPTGPNPCLITEYPVYVEISFSFMERSVEIPYTRVDDQKITHGIITRGNYIERKFDTIPPENLFYQNPSLPILAIDNGYQHGNEPHFFQSITTTTTQNQFPMFFNTEKAMSDFNLTGETSIPVCNTLRFSACRLVVDGYEDIVLNTVNFNKSKYFNNKYYFIGEDVEPSLEAASVLYEFSPVLPGSKLIRVPGTRYIEKIDVVDQYMALTFKKNSNSHISLMDINKNIKAINVFDDLRPLSTLSLIGQAGLNLYGQGTLTSNGEEQIVKISIPDNLIDIKGFACNMTNAFKHGINTELVASVSGTEDNCLVSQCSFSQYQEIGEDSKFCRIKPGPEVNLVNLGLGINTLVNGGGFKLDNGDDVIYSNNRIYIKRANESIMRSVLNLSPINSTAMLTLSSAFRTASGNNITAGNIQSLEYVRENIVLAKITFSYQDFGLPRPFSVAYYLINFNYVTNASQTVSPGNCVYPNLSPICVLANGNGDNQFSASALKNRYIDSSLDVLFSRRIDTSPSLFNERFDIIGKNIITGAETTVYQDTVNIFQTTNGQPRPKPAEYIRFLSDSGGNRIFYYGIDGRTYYLQENNTVISSSGFNSLSGSGPAEPGLIKLVNPNLILFDIPGRPRDANGSFSGSFTTFSKPSGRAIFSKDINVSPNWQTKLLEVFSFTSIINSQPLSNNHFFEIDNGIFKDIPITKASYLDPVDGPILNFPFFSHVPNNFYEASSSESIINFPCTVDNSKFCYTQEPGLAPDTRHGATVRKSVFDNSRYYFTEFFNNAGKLYYFDRNLNLNQFLDDNAPGVSNWFNVNQVLGSLHDSAGNGSVVFYGSFVGQPGNVIMVSDGEGFTVIKGSENGFTSVGERQSVVIGNRLYFVGNSNLFYIQLKNP